MSSPFSLKELHRQYLEGRFRGEFMYGGTSPGNEIDRPSTAKPVTVKDKINRAVAEAEQQLAQAKRAQEILNKNPELEELLNIMNNSVIFRY